MATFDEMLTQALARHKARHDQSYADAKYFIPKMYEALRAEGLSAQDAADRIYKDCLQIWKKDTIRRLLPDETKNPSLSEAGKIGNEKRKLLVAIANGAQLEGITIKDEQSNNRKENKAPELTAVFDETIIEENTCLQERIKDVQRKNELLQSKIAELQEWIRMLRAESERKTPRAPLSAFGKKYYQLPPSLFAKTYQLIRNGRSLVLTISGTDVIDVEVAN